MIKLNRTVHRLCLLFQMTAFVGVIGLPAPAGAAAIFTAGAAAVGNNESQTASGNVTAGTSSSRERDWGIEQGSALAYAGPGRLGAFGSASVEPQLYEYQEGLFGFGRLSASGGGGAVVIFDDIMFSGTVPGATSALVSTNIFVEGVLSASSSSAGRGLSSAGVSVRYGLGVPGPNSTAVRQNIGSVSHSYNNGDFSTLTNGIFSALEPSDALGFSRFFESPSFEVPLDTPVRLSVELAASASVTTQDGGSMSALADFSQSLILGHGGPVFVLPDGITANSVDAGIVNNRIPTQVPIPIPPAASLLASALMALVGMRKVIGDRSV